VYVAAPRRAERAASEVTLLGEHAPQALQLSAGGAMLPHVSHSGKRRPSLRTRLAVYLGTGLLTFAITLARNIGANSLPGSIFTLFVSTSIFFNIVLSKVALRRQINRWHVLAAVLCLGAAGVAGVAGGLEFGEASAQGHKWTLGVPATLLAAFFIATMSVTSDKIVSSWPSKDLHITEMTIVGSLVASALLVPVLFGTKEEEAWRQQIPAAVNGPDATAVTRGVLIGCSVGLPVVKALIRTAKYETISNTSALFFEFVQAGAAILGSIANVLLFPEPWSSTYIVALLLLCASFLVYARGRGLERMKLKALAEEAAIAPDAPVYPIPPLDAAAAKVEAACTAADAEGDKATESVLPPRPGTYPQSKTHGWTHADLPGGVGQGKPSCMVPYRGSLSTAAHTRGTSDLSAVSSVTAGLPSGQSSAGWSSAGSAAAFSSRPASSGHARAGSGFSAWQEAVHVLVATPPAGGNGGAPDFAEGRFRVGSRTASAASVRRTSSALGVDTIVAPSADQSAGVGSHRRQASGRRFSAPEVVLARSVSDPSLHTTLP
jgi:drug/metabolite transporter (DMT)-like permease